jgi:hypothetical protein
MRFVRRAFAGFDGNAAAPRVLVCERPDSNAVDAPGNKNDCANTQSPQAEMTKAMNTKLINFAIVLIIILYFNYKLPYQYLTLVREPADSAKLA